MKKCFLLLIALFICNFIKSQDVQIPNGGFETWNSNTFYYNPSGYYSSNIDASDLNYVNVTKSNDKYQGEFAVKIETKGTVDNISSGSILSGRPNPILGNDPYIGGFPYSIKPDSITGYFKYFLSGNDSATIFVIFKKDGQFIKSDYDKFKIYGIQNSYKKLKFKISNLTEIPDTAIVGIMSSNPDGVSINPGNWIIADNISFVKGTSSTLILNGDFENWSPVGRDLIQNWQDLNSYIPFSGIPYYTKSLDNHNGSFAINLSTTELEINANIRPVSFITTGSFIFENLKAAKPITKGGFKVISNPDSLSLYYKYNNINNENDSALVIVSFRKNNIDFGKTELRLGPTDIYKKVSVKVYAGNALNPPGTIADTANIIISSSDYLGMQDNIGIGNSLIVDDIKFIYNPKGYKISGTVTYDNPNASPLLNNIRVYLKNSENIRIDSTYTDASGKYQFNTVANGSYSLEAKTSKKWRQCNTLDALKANRSFLGTYTITTDMRKKAGDVNNDNKVQPTDALTMNRRFIGTVTSFKRPDWIFENPSVTVNNADVIVDFKGICAGDIGGAYTPPAK